MKKKYFNQFIYFIFKAFFVFCVFSIFLNPFSCKMTEEGIEIVSSSESPQIKSFNVIDKNNVSLSFTKEVEILESSIQDVVTSEYFTVCHNKNIEDNLCNIVFNSQESFVIGNDYEIYGQVKDNSGNTLTFCIPFIGYNESVPILEITEIHPKYTKITSGYKNEYVEILAHSSGNLSGLELISGYDGEDKKYVFPSIDVKEGDYIIVHLRSKGEGCISELNNDLTLSFAKYSSDTARDLWDSNENARLGDDSDVIVLRNSQDLTILDAVIYAENEETEWKKDFQKELIMQIEEQNKWNPNCNIKNSVRFTGMTPSKSLVKISSKNEASSWQITATGEETPGY